MSAALPRRALHLVNAGGGGMSRFARDLIAHAEGHGLLHASPHTWVVEHGSGAAARFTPYRVPPPAAAADWLDALLSDCGCDLLHVHYLCAATLPLLEAWSARGRPWIASLHDVGFLRADAFAQDDGLPPADPAWSARCAQLLARAAAITVPSDFLAQVVARACPGLRVHVVAPGAALHPPATGSLLKNAHPVRSSIGESGTCPYSPATTQSLTRWNRGSVIHDRVQQPAGRARPLRSVAIVGALGAHKGKERLLRWLAHPAAAALRWTLIGYSEDQLQPGWLADGRLRVHGPFLPERTAHWLRHYRADLVVFPNRLAESFGYALSDVWSAGVPVLVPDLGALGERVRAHGGGGLLRDPDDADAVHAELARLAADGGATLARWRAEISRERTAMVPSIESMVAAMSQVYAQADEQDAPVRGAPGSLQRYLRTQLDDRVFRHENIRLARDYAQVRAWADKLRLDVDRLEADLRTQVDARERLAGQLAVRDQAIAALRDRNAAVEGDAAALRARNLAVEADAAALAEAAVAHAQRHAQQVATIAELSAHRQHLSRQLDAEQRRAALLAEVCDAHAGELAIMHQRINALESELRPLRIKGARHDRVLAWLPAPLLSLLRGLRELRNTRRLARGAR